MIGGHAADELAQSLALVALELAEHFAPVLLAVVEVAVFVPRFFRQICQLNFLYSSFHSFPKWSKAFLVATRPRGVR